MIKLRLKNNINNYDNTTTTTTANNDDNNNDDDDGVGCYLGIGTCMK